MGNAEPIARSAPSVLGGDALAAPWIGSVDGQPAPRNAGGLALLWMVLFVLGLPISTIIPTTSAVLGVVLYVVATWYGHRRAPLSFTIMLPIFMIRLLEMISAIVLNTGVLLPELGINSQPSSVFFSLGIIYSLWPLILAQIPVFRRESVFNRPSMSRGRPFAFWLAAAVYGAAILAFYAKYGAPLFYNFGKYEYYTDTNNRVLNILIRYRFGIVVVVGFLIALPIRPIMKLFIGLLYLSLFILGADKVTAPLVALSFFLIPVFALRGNRGLLSLRMLLSGLVILTIIGGTYFGSRMLIASDTSDIWNSIEKRVPEQAQLWYVTANNNPPWASFDSRTSQELQSMLPLGDSEETVKYLGQHRLVRDLSTEQTFKVFDKANASFIMSLYSYVIKYYGIIPLIIFNFILIGVYGFFANYLLKAIENNSFFELLFSGLLMTIMVVGIISGNLSTMFGTNFYIFSALLMICRALAVVGENRRLA